MMILSFLLFLLPAVSQGQQLAPAPTGSGTANSLYGVIIDTTSGMSTAIFSVQAGANDVLFEGNVGDGVWETLPVDELNVNGNGAMGIGTGFTGSFVAMVNCSGFYQVAVEIFAYNGSVSTASWTNNPGSNFVNVFNQNPGALDVMDYQGTSPWADILSTQPVSASTSGVIGSVSFGNTEGKTMVYVSSVANTTSLAQITLSSYTVQAGQTFYIEYISEQAQLAAPSATTTSNLGSIFISTEAAGESSVVISSTPFYVDLGAVEFPSPAQFSEPIPIPGPGTIFIKAGPETTTNTIFDTYIWGYVK